jgi:hypothetical protein
MSSRGAATLNLDACPRRHRPGEHTRATLNIYEVGLAWLKASKDPFTYYVGVDHLPFAASFSSSSLCHIPNSFRVTMRGLANARAGIMSLHNAPPLWSHVMTFCSVRRAAAADHLCKRRVVDEGRHAPFTESPVSTLRAVRRGLLTKHEPAWTSSGVQPKFIKIHVFAGTTSVKEISDLHQSLFLMVIGNG